MIKSLKNNKNYIINNFCDNLIDNRLLIKKYLRPNFIDINVEKINEILKNNVFKWILNNKLIELQYVEYSKICNQSDLLKGNDFVIQSKSSCLPIYYLKNNLEIELKNKVIIDCCAAPGNKTMQLLSEFPNSIILAFEKDIKRFDLLNKRLSKFYKSEFAKYETFNEDFLEVDLHNIKIKYGEIGAVVCDPSCSGSGMLERKNFSNTILNISELDDKEKNRIKKLKEFQIKILTKIIESNIPYISYSTCSIYLEENEEVINDLMNIFSLKIINISNNNKGIINNNDIEYNKEIKNCLRIKPEINGSDGFFVSLMKNNNFLNK